MVDVLHQKNFHVSLGFYVAVSGEFYITKQHWEPKDPYDRSLEEIFEDANIHYYQSVWLLNQAEFHAQCVGSVATYGNEPTSSEVYESIILMIHRASGDSKMTRTRGMEIHCRNCDKEIYYYVPYVCRICQQEDLVL